MELRSFACRRWRAITSMRSITSNSPTTAPTIAGMSEAEVPDVELSALAPGKRASDGIELMISYQSNKQPVFTVALQGESVPFLQTVQLKQVVLSKLLW